MSRNTKIILIAIVIVIIALSIISISLDKEKNKEDNGKINIVATTFSTYDFARQIVGENANVIYLIEPGVESHGYDPSAADLIKIKNADIFIYIGGEMEQWVDRILETNSIDNNKTKLIKVTDCVETIEETEVDGAEEEKEKENKRSI